MSAVLVLAGVTASGKSELAIELAQQFDAEIVGADSRQIYRGMPIGTAAPTPAQRAAVPHHLVEFLEPEARYSAARFARDATAVVRSIRERGKRAIVVGGTGFYIRALTGAVELSRAYDPNLRERLAREARLHDAPFLHEWLRFHDPRRAPMIDPNDGYRIARALEVALTREEPGAAPERLQTLRSFDIPFAKIALDVPQSDVDERIERRTDAMLADGLIEEAGRIGPSAAAADAVGYPAALGYLRGWGTYDELRASLARATRRYARRQRAWLRGEPEIVWLAPSDVATFAREKLGWV